MNTISTGRTAARYRRELERMHRSGRRYNGRRYLRTLDRLNELENVR